MNRIMANYMPNNTRSAAVLGRLGFTIEGTASAYLYLARRLARPRADVLTNPDPVVPA
jgi:ribosomal-protein-alanine N-acetyltransferase